jgi:hypothetical protein
MFISRLHANQIKFRVIGEGASIETITNEDGSVTTFFTTTVENQDGSTTTTIEGTTTKNG